MTMVALLNHHPGPDSGSFGRQPVSLHWIRQDGPGRWAGGEGDDASRS
jgi:hypothetical protein